MKQMNLQNPINLDPRVSAREKLMILSVLMDGLRTRMTPIGEMDVNFRTEHVLNLIQE